MTPEEQELEMRLAFLHIRAAMEELRMALNSLERLVFA